MAQQPSAADVAQCGLDLTRLKFRRREDWRANANWKVKIENYLECYHCAVAHPGFSSVVDVAPDAYVLRPFEWFSSQCAPVRAGALDGRGTKAAYDCGRPRTDRRVASPSVSADRSLLRPDTPTGFVPLSVGQAQWRGGRVPDTVTAARAGTFRFPTTGSVRAAGLMVVRGRCRIREGACHASPRAGGRGKVGRPRSRGDVAGVPLRARLSA